MKTNEITGESSNEQHNRQDLLKWSVIIPLSPDY